MKYILLAIFILHCAAVLCLVPPYESFDETAHYSYISLLADRREIPDFRRSPFDRIVEPGAASMPRAYRAVPPYEQIRGITYDTFFNRLSAEERQRITSEYWRSPSSPVCYAPGVTPNWEGQHPPLYYLVMGVPYRLLRSVSQGHRILGLRIFSTLIAAGGVVFWLWRVGELENSRMREFLLTGFFILICIPSMPLDLARVGNDCLAATISALLFVALIPVAEKGILTWRTTWILAVILGTGMLVKLFMLPVWIGTLVALTVLRGKRGRYGSDAAKLGLMVILPMAISGAWWLLYHQRYGAFFSGHEFYLFETHRLPQVSIPVFHRMLAPLRILTAFVTTFFWSGTWSTVRREFYQYFLLLPVIACFLTGFTRWLRHRNGSRFIRRWTITAICILCPLLAGFGYHMIRRLIATGVGAGTSGYYLFVVWPFLAVLIGVAAGSGCHRGGPARLLKMSLLLMLIFDVWGWWILNQVYAGLIVKSGFIRTGTGAMWPMPSHIVEVIGRLKILCFPGTAWLTYSAAILLKLVLVFRFPVPLYNDDDAY